LGNKEAHEMKRLLVVAIALIFAICGCATFGFLPKTSNEYTYSSSINPDDIESGKYGLIESGMINPFVSIGFYFQPEKNRVVGAVFVFNEDTWEYRLFRIFYVENNELIFIDRNDEKKTWEKRSLVDLEINNEYKCFIMETLTEMRKKLKSEQDI